MRITVRPRAMRDLKKLPHEIAHRIIEKLEFYGTGRDPLAFAKPLWDPEVIGQYRFRIGDYRVIFDVDNDEVIVLRVGHRKDIYR